MWAGTGLTGVSLGDLPEAGVNWLLQEVPRGRYLVTRADLRRFWRDYLPSPEAGGDPHASSPLAEDLQGLPPALGVAARYDPLRDEAKSMRTGWRSPPWPGELKRYQDLIHACFQMGAVIDRSRSIIDDVATAVRVTLRTEEAPRPRHPSSEP